MEETTNFSSTVNLVLLTQFLDCQLYLLTLKHLIGTRTWPLSSGCSQRVDDRLSLLLAKPLIRSLRANRAHLAIKLIPTSTARNGIRKKDDHLALFAPERAIALGSGHQTHPN